MADPTLHILGIRHHGPGSARSVHRRLTALQPDIVLVEGPPDADGILDTLNHDDLQPPIAILIYAADHPQAAVYYPFATFSPEFQAIRYALTHNIPVRLMDLPQTHQLARQLAVPEAEPSSTTDPTSTGAPIPEIRIPEAEQEADPAAAPGASQSPPGTIRRDPLAWLAEAAGYSDSERWWEHMVEQRHGDADLFEAILEAMQELRTAVEQADPPSLDRDRDRTEALREAHMRKTIRQAQKEGHQTIAVVCGAWHGPALTQPLPPAKHDQALLKGLPKCKVKATWIPWTYERLTWRSGYDAGIAAPGWYEHLWFSHQDTATHWLTRIARLLRQQDMDASSASVIEAVRLATSLAALRERPMPGLTELNEAAQTVLCFGDELPMRLIHEQLMICDRIGQVPVDTPLVPLQADLHRQLKTLRLKLEASIKEIQLDLRKPNDLGKSQLLHRLILLGIPWGTRTYSRSKGTFKEAWQLQWQPEFEITLIEAGQWGHTITTAVTAYGIHRAEAAAQLPDLTRLLEQILLATLPDAIPTLMACLQAQAAVASDIAHLMAALPPLANILRYQDVRQTDTAIVAQVVTGLVSRICIGLPGACASLDDDAAATMDDHLLKTHAAIQLLQNDTYRQDWQGVLEQLATQNQLHGLIAGRCCRLLLDAGAFDPSEAARRLNLALSTASEPTQAASWIEGFLQGSGLLLLHDDAIWQVLDRWITGLSAETFLTLLPLLRRTFAHFPAPERWQMGERVRQGTSPSVTTGVAFADIDAERAATSLPLIAQLLGITP